MAQSFVLFLKRQPRCVKFIYAYLAVYLSLPLIFFLTFDYSPIAIAALGLPMTVTFISCALSIQFLPQIASIAVRFFYFLGSMANFILFSLVVYLLFDFLFFPEHYKNGPNVALNFLFQIICAIFSICAVAFLFLLQRLDKSRALSLAGMAISAAIPIAFILFLFAP